MIIFYYLLVLIYLLLAEKHAVKGEQAGGAVAQDKLRRVVQPTGKPRVIHARIQRTCRHVEIGMLTAENRYIFFIVIDFLWLDKQNYDF